MKTKLVSCFFFTLTTVCVASQDTTKTISTRAGIYKGLLRELNVFGKTKTVEKYLGIPYAESPRRFRKSVIKVPLSRDTVYDATRYRASCSQLAIPLANKPGLNMQTSEDCLFLNIFKPFCDGDTSTKRAVMVHFHGGGFVIGSPQLYPGDMLSSYGDVIVVTVNYRLALWGFLSTGDKTLPGNRGLWDQHIALKWLHENIEDFGGDPNNVAIVGHSAGASSVVYHSLFPGNKGLFQRVIAISGSITNIWSFQPHPLDITLRIGELLGCNIKASTEDVVHCIESTSGEKLEETLNKKENGFVRFPMELVTVIDGEFLSSNPYNVINDISVVSPEVKEWFASLDFMTGVTSGEGAMNLDPFAGVDDAENFAPSRAEFVKEIVPLIAKSMYGENVPELISDMIVDKYTNWTNPDDITNIRQSFLRMTGDYVFNFHAKLVADMHANLSSTDNTFAYHFEAFPSQHLLTTPSWVSKPNHADELTFLFGYDKAGYLTWTGPYSDDYEPSDWELDVSKLYMAVFANFIKSG